MWRRKLCGAKAFQAGKVHRQIPDLPRQTILPFGDFTGWGRQAVVQILRYSAARFHENVEALKSVQPEDLSATEIDVRLGASWLPPEDVKQFIHKLLNVSSGIEIVHIHALGTWHVNGDWGDMPEEDKQENEFSIQHGFRIFSAYTTSAGERIWIITEADRSATTILLPTTDSTGPAFLSITH